MDTSIYFDPVNKWLDVVVQGVEVARFKPDGDIDLNGVVNQNSF